MPISEAQTEALQLRESGMTKKQIAAHLGISFDAVKDRLQRAKKWQSVTPGQAAAMEASGLDVGNARHGWRIVQHKDGSRDSVFWKADGVEDQETYLEAVRSAFEDMAPATPVVAPDVVLDDLCTVWPIMDLHLGMHAWGRETGDQDYDLGLACQDLRHAFAKVSAMTPASKEGVLILGGDTLHADGREGPPRPIYEAVGPFGHLRPSWGPGKTRPYGAVHFGRLPVLGRYAAPALFRGSRPPRQRQGHRTLAL